MATRVPDASLQRACTRGTIIGLVVAAHIAVIVAVLVPVRARRLAPRAIRRNTNVLRVALLSPPPQRAASTHRLRQLPKSSAVVSHRQPITRVTSALQASLLPAPSGSTTTPMPAFISGGGFNARLRAAQSPPHSPKLPGGHRYLAADLQFIPIEQQSIEGKVHKVAGFIFGWYDPVCKNIAYELAKPRLQMIADGYSRRELQQRAREHHCN